jgi:hypothetical protein
LFNGADATLLAIAASAGLRRRTAFKFTQALNASKKMASEATPE